MHSKVRLSVLETNEGGGDPMLPKSKFQTVRHRRVESPSIHAQAHED